MAEHGGDAHSVGRIRRSRLYEYAETTETGRVASPAHPGPAPVPLPVPVPVPEPEHSPPSREFAALLGVFRRTAVLVPLDGAEGAPLTADFGGVRWIYAFSNEPALARFAVARGEGDREWAYQRWLGARLLDAGVPAVGVPCGVALDVGSEGEGVLFPPVTGIVPDAVAVETNGEGPR
ncbi:hypothetical protein AB0N17_24255 [Streptomyces sp. NPDC051133]|uniref:hypothetical protein n=1 Tax=Streptomyces sp. NPDC051133 TaxID=3155521 RepID=UPI00341AEC1B